MNSQLCSIIIPTYNHAKYIERSISCALAQTYKEIEVIVIDDGSTDDTPEIVKKFGDSIIYHRKTNGGLGAARNTGLKMSSGKYIQFLDSDDIIDKKKVEKQVKILEKDERIAVVYSDCSCTEPGGTEIGNTSYSLAENENPLPVLLKRTLFSVHAGIVRRSVIEDVGLFDESRVAQEDWDLWLRIALKGHAYKYMPGNLAHYDQSGSGMVHNPTLMFRRTKHLLNKFLNDPAFCKLNKVLVNDFIKEQNLSLATRAYNNGWWQLSRRHFIKAIRARPGKTQFKYWLCVPKTFLREIGYKIKGRKTNLPEGIS
jgi:glycosyltransferase involved in cell wall biosynthesis